MKWHSQVDADLVYTSKDLFKEWGITTHRQINQLYPGPLELCDSAAFFAQLEFDAFAT